MNERTLAVRILVAVVIVVVLAGATALFLFTRSDKAQERSVSAQKGVATNTAQIARNTRRARRNRALIVRQRRELRQIRTLLSSARRIIRQQSRILLRTGIARRAAGGRIMTGSPEAIRGPQGRMGLPGPPGMSVTEQQLSSTFAPLVPPALAMICAGNACDGPPGQDAPPPTQDQVTAALLFLCQTNQLDCTIAGPAGPMGPEGPPGPTPAQDALPPACDPVVAGCLP